MEEAVEDAAAVVIVQMLLQDTDEAMGPLTVEPRTHCRPAAGPRGPGKVERRRLALAAAAGSLLLFDGCVRHFGGEHKGGSDRVVVYFTLMQEKSSGRPVARGSTWALAPALWGRCTLASLPRLCGDPRIPKWTFEQEQLGAPLLQAAGVLGSLADLQRLLEHHDRKEGETGTRPLHAAAKCGRASVAVCLLGRRAEVNATSAEGHLPLHLAVEGGHYAVTELLLQARADAAAADAAPAGGEAQALHLAAWRGHESLVRLLASAAADPAAADGAGARPLHRAAASGHAATIKSLLELRAYVSALDSRGRLPLHLAAAAGHASAAAGLLAARALVLADDAGATPLHWAAAAGHLALVSLLLAHRADNGAATAGGALALDMARARGHALVAGCLRDAGWGELGGVEVD